MSTIDENFKHITNCLKSHGVYEYETVQIPSSLTMGISNELENPLLNGSYSYAFESSEVEFFPIFLVNKAYLNKLTKDMNQSPEFNMRRSIGINNAISTFSGGDVYGHSLIGFTDDLKTMYSFEAGHGIVTDDITNESKWLNIKSIYISVVFVTADARDRMISYVNGMMKNRDNTKYMLSNTWKTVLGKPVKTPGGHVCSSFVAQVLSISDPKNLNKDYSRWRPEDLTLIPRSYYIDNYKNCKDFADRFSQFQSKWKSILEDNIDELIEYNEALPRYMIKDKSTVSTIEKLHENTIFENVSLNDSDNIGIMYPSYQHVLKILSEFITDIDVSIWNANHRTDGAIDGADDDDYDSGDNKDFLNTKRVKHVNVSNLTKKFKSQTSFTPVPSEIIIEDMKKYSRHVNKMKILINRIVRKFANIKQRSTPTGSLFKTLINRPKLYSKEVDPESYKNSNKSIREINIALDNAEKVILNLRKLIYQDENVITFMNQVYMKKKIFESLDMIELDDGDDEMNESYNHIDSELDELLNLIHMEESNEENEQEHEPENKIEPVSTKAKSATGRKELYGEFVEYSKKINQNNAFSTVFDADAFKVNYTFVPQDMKYFYRMSNPVLCVLDEKLTFFAVDELKKINENNQKFPEMLIFAATPDDRRIFNTSDNKIYKATDGDEIVLGDVLADTFDNYIRNVIAGV